MVGQVSERVAVPFVREPPSFELPAASVLATLPDSTPLHHSLHRLRHPLGVYNIAVAATARRLSRVLESLAAEWSSDPKQPSHWDEAVIEAYDAFLDALMELMDDCDNVLLCFFPDKRARNKQAAVKRYRKRVNGYRDHIGLLVNHIKHNQGRVRLISIVPDPDRDLAPVHGYFAEAVVDGVLGPHPGIHDGNTAFSFNRDLRFHAVNVLVVSAALADAVQELATGAFSLPKAPKDLGRNDRLLDVLLRVAGLPRTVFPDEVTKPWPSLRTGAVERGEVLVAEFPGTDERPERVGGLVTTRTTGDGTSRSFRMPYMGRPSAGNQGLCLKSASPGGGLPP